MSTRPAPLHLAADRRAREAAHAAPSEFGVRGTVSKTVGKQGSVSRTPERPPGAGLTRRERRVKAILLKELQKLSKGTGLTYKEHQKLRKTLDVTFIDAELATMRKQLRMYPLLIGVVAVAFGLFFGFQFWTAAASGTLAWDSFFLLLPVVSGALSPWIQARSIRRKIFIYEALRELSDAEDEGVQLDESVRLADLLIDRIVEAEEAAARQPLHRIRT